MLDPSLERGEGEGSAEVACQCSLNNGNRPNGCGFTHHGGTHTPTPDVQAAIAGTAEVNSQREQERGVKRAGVTRDVLL